MTKISLPAPALSLALSVAMLLIMAPSCRSGADADRNGAAGDTLTRHTRFLTLTDRDGWIEADFPNPWQEGAGYGRLALIERDAPMPALPAGITPVRVPLERSVVTQAVHMGAIEELGALDRVTGVADAEFITLPSVKKRLAEGTMTNCGIATEPSIERIIEADADAILMSPYADSDHSALRKMKIPVIEMADYMETTPEARAEWLRLLGILYGRRAEADSTFSRSMAEYTRLKNLAAATSERPKVLTEQLTSGVWYVPGAQSYMARLITDAGALYPFARYNTTGSAPLDLAAVIDLASDADIWLLKTFGTPVSLQSLETECQLYSSFKAWQQGNVYVADTKKTHLYEEFPFHPERLLAEYILIFHPELASDLPEARYYHRIQ
nr:ABC transporter substrate-binding protein [Bacteroides sp.]